MLKVIKATPKNIPEIQEIANKSWAETYKNILSKEQIDYMLTTMYATDVLKAQMENVNYNFYICINSDISIGFIAFELNYNNLPKTKIHKLYILPDFQGKGIGKILLDKSIKYALQNCNTTLVLNVNKQNSAKYFYEKMGFTVSYQEVINIGNGYVMDDFVLEKNILNL
jgi:ribosomal protein S18 acetylase RimI-like enzyme